MSDQLKQLFAATGRAETRSTVASMMPGMVTTTARAVQLKAFPQVLRAYSIADA